ncbi:MAG: tRNA (5-methylaminomethyl-2-thiouridine)(34)-methyltransferase MnmD [Cyclobacteriaceae bacterium]
MPLQIITTSDGSHSLLNTELNETYHSVHGAMRESIHVFIKNGLDHYMKQHNPKEIDILEIGFGTGLNALLTLQYAIQNNIYVRYTTLETSPLHENIWSQLNFPEGEVSRVHFRLLHETPWGTSTSLFPQFTLLKLNEPLQDVTFPDVYHVVYFDAFAPNKQPEMWEQPLLQKVAKSMKVNGVYVTYCAKGKLKRDLRDLSFKVETIPGPPGKREMVRALKI